MRKNPGSGEYDHMAGDNTGSLKGCQIQTWISLTVRAPQVPPKNSAKFEKITKKNRTLEHEVKVYTELLRDLRAFVKDRVGNTVTLNLPNLYHGFTAKNDPGPDGDRSAFFPPFLVCHEHMVLIHT